MTGPGQRRLETVTSTVVIKKLRVGPGSSRPGQKSEWVRKEVLGSSRGTVGGLPIMLTQVTRGPVGDVTGSVPLRFLTTLGPALNSHPYDRTSFQLLLSFRQQKLGYDSRPVARLVNCTYHRGK